MYGRWAGDVTHRNNNRWTKDKETASKVDEKKEGAREEVKRRWTDNI